ncbi:cysteine desulfurase [Candidatus Saccharibacteria bacterium]|nr:cysteine desulfurase [Candidatus Saccharibacteria bacterium]MBR3256657.1 cysteine desulfurase [Candidatus Saccharibacteria bacterium]
MIYLDHAAATPVSEKVLEAMKPYFSDEFFNPSAAYLPAKKVAHDYEKAKGVIAHAIGAKASDLVISAGATEANNLAFTAILDGQISHSAPRPAVPSARAAGAKSRAAALRNAPSQDICPVLYLATEHDSVRCVAEQFGGTAISVLPNGLIDLEDLKAKITDDTELISVSLANNELGTIQPLAEIAAIVREVKLDRMKRGIKKQLLLHSDASQALNLLDINVARLGVDLLTLNAAKVYGPKGVGALYVSHDAKLKPLTVGGGQENGLRSGTENVPGVIGFAKAVELAKEHLNGNRKKYATWRKILIKELQGCELINKKHSLDNFIVICYNKIDAERLVFLLEEKGVYVATGAACAASKGVRSHALKAIGLSDEQIAGSLRLTLGETNTEEQIHEAAQIINTVLEQEQNRLIS